MIAIDITKVKVIGEMVHVAEERVKFTKIIFRVAKNVVKVKAKVELAGFPLVVAEIVKLVEEIVKIEVGLSCSFITVMLFTVQIVLLSLFLV